MPREERQRRAVVDTIKTSVEKSEEKTNREQPMKWIVQEAELLLGFRLVVHIAQPWHCQ